MLPFSFEWVWDTVHLVFHGGLWDALLIFVAGPMLGLLLPFTIVGARPRSCRPQHKTNCHPVSQSPSLPAVNQSAVAASCCMKATRASRTPMSS